ncbi:MAG: DUF2066 domain-containing protein [Proteobacteria bacterium]|nr:DUF2066 domain-containing protein [Pseudomonadota bacterium]
MFRRLLIVNFISCCCLLLLNGNAIGADVFAIRDVEVKERASNEVSAKTAALAAGQRKALAALLKRITLVGDHARLPRPTDQLVSEMVSDFAVSNEKFGGGRYHAKLSVRFKPDTVRSLLKRLNISFAETASRPMVVLPVLNEGNAYLLWDEPNSWFDLWAELVSPDGLLPLMMPLRELSDVSIITAEQALAGHLTRLRGIALKYNTRGVVVPVVEFSANKAKNVLRAEIKLITFAATGHVKRTASAYESQPGMAASEFHKQVALALIQQLQEDWKRANLLTSGNMNSLTARIPLTKLAEWLYIKEQLQKVATIKHIGMKRMSVRETEISILFQGDPGQLRVALAQNGLNLSQNTEQSIWLLQRINC